LFFKYLLLLKKKLQEKKRGNRIKRKKGKNGKKANKMISRWGGDVWNIFVDNVAAWTLKMLLDSCQLLLLKVKINSYK
jgi:hypothetical protein